ncbi:ionic transporter y4hA [Erythrobacter arachoides]|uniref:Ionic transporter y4hA n=1 Tax=Aurantiacibacter arachoides TaxID=1850444 RepID=A0A845A247_9SPHN|nr:ionic transporter y4hA [Aurantiacibacter arachoides]MXO94611.1 ionic transporter y4hA [Aurantiacibacter arachoides]GGD62113.1 ionic transporter y4hA [Aurantiacibacter arachoides]
MPDPQTRRPPLWTIIAPGLAMAGLLVGEPSSLLVAGLLGVLLGGAILASVYHAEVLAHYLGEPFGTLVLALAVTIIETSLIVSIMLGEGSGAQTLARDTLIAAIMITINAIVGVCLLVGGGRHYEQGYTQSGVSVGLAMLSTLAVLTLILPNFTVSERGPFYTDSQLIFVAVISLVVYGTFVMAQTIRHRDHFLYADPAADAVVHVAVPRNLVGVSAAILVVTLVAVVLLAKMLSSSIEDAVGAIGAPQALVGVIIASLVLAPEGFAALSAARQNRVQTSLNLALGSALATIGLTIPAVAIAALAMGLDLELGLSMRSTVLLALTLLVATLTLSTGRTTIVHGVIHLVIFASYLFITIIP